MAHSPSIGAGTPVAGSPHNGNERNEPIGKTACGKCAKTCGTPGAQNGTGGTTPIPKALLRGAFDILTLDRFTFWACMLILPLAGLTIESWRHGAWRVFVQARFGARVHHLLGLLLVTLALGISVGISALTYYRKFQPDRIDVRPIVQFLESGGRDRYRYIVRDALPGEQHGCGGEAGGDGHDVRGEVPAPSPQPDRRHGIVL